MYEARSRDIVLRKVREALAKSAPVVPPTPDFSADLYPPLDDDLSVTFATNFLKNSGTFIYCESEEDFFDQLFAYKQEKGIQNLFVWEQEWQVKLHAAGINFLEDENNFIKQGDAGLTTCEALIARTGSVFVTGTTESGRRLSIYPEKHLIVARMTQLVPDIKDGLHLIKNKYGSKVPSMISLVSGPSRTADIEKTLVMGAHGPRELVLFLIDDIPIKQLPTGKKIYFASDFHLGVPDAASSLIREKKIVRWLDQVKADAELIILVGDIFDFWFEYKHAIPRGFIRLQGKLAEITDNGIPVYFFTGNHDMWMFDYFTKELNIPIIRKPITTQFGDKTFLIGHGDGLGPKDYTYKLLKRVFANKLCQWLFARIHPNLGIGIASMWSRRSRISNTVKDEVFKGEREWLITYCREMEKHTHHDFYVFGHRHLPLNIQINSKARYVNLGEWVNFYSYAVFDGKQLTLEYFEK